MSSIDPSRSWPLPFSEIAQLELSANVAAIQLVPVEEGGTPRLELRGAATQELNVEVEKVDELVRVRLGYRNAVGMWEFGSNAKLTLYVPKNVRARLGCDFGRIHVQGLDGGCDLQITSSAGAMFLDGVTGRMVLRTGAGKIAGDRLAGTFDVETSAGAVHLGILGLQPGNHRLRTNMGSVRVDLAPNIPVRIETHTSMGSVRTRYPSTADAPAVLQLATDLGAVKVKERRGDDGEELHGDFPRWDSVQIGGWDPAKWARTWVGAFTEPFAQRHEHDRPPERPAKKTPLGDEELRRILTMVESGTITAQDAEKLIRAIEDR